MYTEFLPGIFGAALLICLCHCARINGPLGLQLADSNNSSSSNVHFGSNNGSSADSFNGTILVASTKQHQHGTRSSGNARCLWSIKKWLLGDSGIMSGNPDDVRFFLYPNPNDRAYSEEIVFGDVSKLRAASFYPGTQLKIIIHGFTKNYVSESVQLIKDAYLVQMAQTMRNGGNAFNVILVDWEPLGKPKVGEDLEGLFYRLAVGNVPVVGRRVGEFIQFLIANGAVSNLKNVHVIGFSLGAHIAGQAGNTLKEYHAGQPPARVTGLDPAGPAFYEKLSFSSRHLHKTDGRFVDVIHTNMGALGTVNALGNVDFYPNGGGPTQPQCEAEYEQQNAQKNGNESSIWDSRLLMISSCSHNKAPHFFAMSILNPQMIACKCDSYLKFRTKGCPCHELAIFGEFCDPRTKGKFYLDI